MIAVMANLEGFIRKANEDNNNAAVSIPGFDVPDPLP